MVECRSRLRRTLEAGEPVVVSSDLEREDLERNLAAELGVLGEVDLTHAAAPELRQALVAKDDR